MEFKGKKLNNKGFTLIELLAVVVILALLMSISVTSVLNSMNNSRISTLHSQAKSFVSWYSETVAEDELLSSSEKTISVDTTRQIAQSSSWICLSDLSDDIAKDYGLSASNFVLDGAEPVTTSDTNFSVTSETCSAIRTGSNGAVEVILVAAQDGKFNVAKYEATFAITSEDAGCVAGEKSCADTTKSTE